MENLKSASRLILVLSITGILSVGLLMNGCAKKGEEVKPEKEAPKVSNNDSSLTYTVTVKPIINKYCEACHVSVYVTHLDDYNSLKNSADSGSLSNRLFTLKDMPPAGSPKPNEDELAKIKKWIDDGCKE